VPNNALVVAVGDFQAPAVLARIRQRFGAVPRAPAPPTVLAVEPAQNGERRVTVTREAELPIVYLAYHVPSHASADAPALEVLSTVLSGGRSSRLYRSLVYERQIALEAGGDYSYFSIDPSLFWFWGTPLPGQTPETMEKSLLEEMGRLQREPVSDEELRRAKNQIEASFVFAEDSIHRRTSLLARFEMIGGHALRESFLAKIRAVSAADLQRVARAYFPEDRKNVGLLLPKR
jgi:zinc protease